MSDLDNVIFHRKQLKDANERVLRAEGRLEVAMEQLLQDHKCPTVDAGRTVLKKLQREREQLHKEYQAKLEAFEEKWKKHLYGQGSDPNTD